jgi:hypothetical protein
MQTKSNEKNKQPSKCKSTAKPTAAQSELPSGSKEQQQNQAATMSARANFISPRSKSETKPRPGSGPHSSEQTETLFKKLVFEPENALLCSKYKALLESKKKEQALKAQAKKRPAPVGGGNLSSHKPISPVLSLLGWKTAKQFIKK